MGAEAGESQLPVPRRRCGSQDTVAVEQGSADFTDPGNMEGKEEAGSVCCGVCVWMLVAVWLSVLGVCGGTVCGDGVVVLCSPRDIAVVLSCW